MEALQSSLYHLHAEASKAGKGSAAHRELIAARHAIASAWRAFQRHAVWPSPVVEFRILLDHLRQPAPTALPDEPDANDESERIAFRLRTLMQAHHLRPAPDIFITPELGKLLGLPLTPKTTMALRTSGKLR